MRRYTLSGLLGLFLLAAPHAGAQVSFSFSFGEPPPPPRVYRVPARPAPEFLWVEGYWYPANGRWSWHDGYWTRPPYSGAYWVEPYYYRGSYIAGYWEGGRHDRDRDYDKHDRKNDRHRR